MISHEDPQRIAVFLHSLIGGGAERVMLTLACGLADRGFKVDLVLARAIGPYLQDVPSSLRLIDLGARHVSTSVPALVRYLRRERPMALLAAQDHVNVMAIHARSLARVPTKLIVTVHSFVSIAARNASNLRGRWMPWFMRHSYGRADRVVAVSQAVADDLIASLQLSVSAVVTIYNPIITPQLISRSQVPLKHSWFASGQPPVILSVGRLEPVKDYSTLIRAFAIVRRKRPARFLILGEGGQRAEIERLVRELGLEDDVSLPGFVDNPYQYMKRASVFVLSSRWEGLPTVIIEAMACDTPVVSTNCPGGASEILEEGKWGILVPVGDSDTLAAGIVDVLSAQTHPEILSRAGAFSVDAAVDKYMEVLGCMQ